MGPEILAFVSHYSANLQPILDCFIPNFKLKYEDLENIKADRVNTIVFNLHEIKRRAFFGDTRYIRTLTSVPFQFICISDFFISMD